MKVSLPYDCGSSAFVCVVPGAVLVRCSASLLPSIIPSAGTKRDRVNVITPSHAAVLSRQALAECEGRGPSDEKQRDKYESVPDADLISNSSEYQRRCDEGDARRQGGARRCHIRSGDSPANRKGQTDREKVGYTERGGLCCTDRRGGNWQLVT
jgi:hypothetical protein